MPADRRTKATQNKDKAGQLNVSWGVGAVQFRHRETGDWYHRLTEFPAALFDANGYLLFENEEAYRSSPHILIGKQIGVRKPGISAVPGYVRVRDSAVPIELDVDVHEHQASEGRQRLVTHLRRERNQTLIQKKKHLAPSLECEACGFSFARTYGQAAAGYCEVHHLVLLAEAKDSAITKLEDLAILCANCHRLVHLRNPPYTLAEVKEMLAVHRKQS